MKKLLLILFFPLTVSGQVLDSELMTSANNSPGFRYQNTQTFTGNYYLEIRFIIESSKFSSNIEYRCNDLYPEGAYLFDSAAGAAYGHFNAVIGGNRRLCFMEYSRPASGASTDIRTYQFGVELDTCYTLTAQRTGNVSIVSLNDSFQVYTAAEGGVPYSWQNRSNGVTVGKESQGYNDPLRIDSFPGQISYINDNGFIIDDFRNLGELEGSATIATDLCGETAPPPPPPPPQTACDIDPDSVACACETDPHPACTMCVIDPA